VVAAWLPDSLIKDMTYGHVFKTSKYGGQDGARFVVSRADLKKSLAPAAFERERYLDGLPDAWWTAAYRVKDNGGHLPARVAALCQNARDMLKMGDKDVYEQCGVTPPAGHAAIADDLLYSTRDVAVMMDDQPLHRGRAHAFPLRQPQSGVHVVGQERAQQD
jgi:hypothetical protein